MKVGIALGEEGEGWARSTLSPGIGEEEEEGKSWGKVSTVTKYWDWGGRD